MIGFLFPESLSFEDFCKILQQLKPTSGDDLMKAFRKIDVNGDGFITHSELTKVLTQVMGFVYKLLKVISSVFRNVLQSDNQA